MLLVTTTYPSYGWDFFGITFMNLPKDKKLESSEIICSEELKAKKRVIEKRQEKTLSELGKTVAELKNGLYRLDKPPED